MLWADFYDNFWDWADSTRRTRISSLEDIGPGDEIVDVILEIEDEKVRAQLIRKAMKLGAQFTQDDFMNLDGELDSELYEQLGKYANYDSNDPYFDEDNINWEDFYQAYYDWNEEILTRRLQKLKTFGPSEEVCEAVQSMPTLTLENMLYQKAVAAGVKFTPSEMEEMGNWDDSLSDDTIDSNPTEARNFPRRRRRFSFWGALAALLFSSSNHSPYHDTGRCNGDCDNCPAHYGYRYGRWYYGHGHQRGCERGGNGGLSGRTYRD